MQEPQIKVKYPAASGGVFNIKNFSGGLYATAEATYGPDSNLDETWKNLHHWLSQNEEYEYGDHQWLEEHITKAGVGGFHEFKLFMAIKPV